MDRVVIPTGITPTGIGIAQREDGTTLKLLCPECKKPMSYRSATGHRLDCDCGISERVFPGIDPKELYWSNPLYQQVVDIDKDTDNEVIAWIERWTGLKNITIKIEG